MMKNFIIKYFCLIFLSLTTLSINAQTEFEYKILSENEVGIKSIKDKNVESIEIPYSVTDGVKEYSVVALLDYSMQGCNNLKEVYMPETIRTIGEGVFAGCKSLKTIEFSPNLTSIGDEAFTGCYRLNNIELPSSLKKLGEAVFYDCHSLSNISYPTIILKNIPDYTFYGCGFSRFRIPNNCTKIGKHAFSNCKELSYLVIPENVETIQEGAFAGCRKLTDITCLNPRPQNYSKTAFTTSQYISTLYVPYHSVKYYKNLWEGLFNFTKPCDN